MLKSKKRHEHQKNRKSTTKLTTFPIKLVRHRVTLSMSDLVENNVCTFQDNMPDPDNCQSYYSCKENVIARIHCPDRQLFDEDTRICNDYRKVFCGNRPTNERGNDPCIFQLNGWYADNENQCRSYYLCTEQRKTKMGECLLGSKWNSQKLRCDDPRNIVAPCGLRTNHGISLSHQYYSTIVMIFLFLLTFQ